MTLSDKAYLRIDDGSGTTATFELQIGFEETTDIDKSYVLGNRGQYIRQVFDTDVTPLSNLAQGQRRTGYYIDGGAGVWQPTLQFRTGLEDVEWGDGSGGTGPSNVVRRDASGADVKPISRKHVMEWWLARTRTDSFGQARLYWGEWTDGSIDGDAGAFNQPMPVAILSAVLSSPGVESGKTELDGTLELVHISLFPLGPDDERDEPDWATDYQDTVADQLDFITDH